MLVTPLFDGNGELSWFLGSQVELGNESTSVFIGRREKAVIAVNSLPPRQRQVLELIAKGLLNKQIAYELGVSEATIKAHVSAVLQKLGVDSRTQAVILLSRIGTDPLLPAT